MGILYKARRFNRYSKEVSKKIPFSKTSGEGAPASLESLVVSLLYKLGLVVTGAVSGLGTLRAIGMIETGIMETRWGHLS